MHEFARLKCENELLRKRLGLLPETLSSSHVVNIQTSPENLPKVTNNSSTDEKIQLFRSLFRGREDVYPVRWETKSGKSGYSPACSCEWNRIYCDKPRIKCGQCENRKLLPLTNKVIYDHLDGNHTIGIYPLLRDDTCWFIAADFDKSGWQEDVAAFMKTCQENGVPAILERSRSGKGAHVWIFFSELVPASTARQVGCYLLTLTMENSLRIGFDSYDRFFPNQDTLPKGGFGNVIALPLQKVPRSKENSVFLDLDFQPYPDQWAFYTIKKPRKRNMLRIGTIA